MALLLMVCFMSNTSMNSISFNNVKGMSPTVDPTVDSGLIPIRVGRCGKYAKVLFARFGVTCPISRLANDSASDVLVPD